ncbi:MAG: SGNH/GDSL hydrolase family protein [Betaproteobacteria bacterium]
MAVPLALVLGSAAVVACTLVGLEALVRLHAPDHLFLTRLHVFSQTYGWAPRRGIGVEVDGKRVSFNASGYRGRELASPKAGDRTRVVVLGDSIAFGLGVSDDETFSNLLDVRDNGIEAGNLAVQGYGPDQELLVLMHQGLRADPDVVVLAFCLANDFVDVVLPVSLYDGRSPKPRFGLAGDRLVLDDSNLRRPALRRVQQWLSDHSHLFERLTAGPAAPSPAESDWHERYKAALRDEDYVLRLNLALVRRMRDLCQERGSAFLVALFPDRPAYRDKSPLERSFCEALRSDDIQVVDMSQHFKMSGQRWKAFAFDGIGHLTPLGHSIASEVLEREITSRAQWASRS